MTYRPIEDDDPDVRVIACQSCGAEQCVKVTPDGATVWWPGTILQGTTGTLDLGIAP